MRQIAAIIVIILISLTYTTTGANKKFELEFDDELPTQGTSFGNGVKTKDEKVQKDAFSKRGCPLCDSSVYPYCEYKIYHDACCCGLSAPQCQLNDCSYLHANSCEEHQLITKCCCYNPYRSL